MTTIGKILAVTLWLLSQWQCFAHATGSGAYADQVPDCGLIAQNQSNYDYDAGSQPCPDHDLASPYVTTRLPSELTDQGHVTSDYDAHLSFVIPANTTARGPPAGEIGFVAAKKTMVIGENVLDRVGPYAKKIVGAEIYEGLPGFKPGMEAAGLLDNQAVIQQKMAEGYKIIDIGPDFTKRALRGGPSPNYQMERTITKGYEGYQKAFIRTGKDSLILPEP